MEETLVEVPRKLDEAVRLSDEHALRYRGDFPILDRKVHGKPLVYLDNSATSQKPRAVLDALDDYYTRLNANVHRGLHTLSEEATNAYEAARERVARFINAPARNLVFVRNTTEGINLVASAWGRKNVGAGDEILLSVMEHHSNIVPWQILARETGAVLRYFDIREDGSLDMDQADELITERTRIVSIAHMSNVLGTVNPVKAIVERAHAVGALVFVDAAQSVPHMPVDVGRLGCDFFAFSGHKMCGPTGIGGLYGRQELLESMDPYMGGGSMIDEVRLDGFTCADIPEKFEAGTPNIAHAIVFGDVVDYLSAVGMEHIHTHEKALTNYTIERLEEIDGLTVFGHAPGRGGAISFNLDNMHPSDLSTVLDRQGIAIRAGHHCAQPLMRRIGTPYGATARASLYFYNTSEEIDIMIGAIHRARNLFGT
ncbi:MAG: cysteine desulfurase [Gemmatimonadetes bacterium]|nr:cysteine desulfurase [Gemmatimonadota bacterium]MYG16408.1 cysteine desulfurase [Gemmatimonadota bacterium]